MIEKILSLFIFYSLLLSLMGLSILGVLVIFPIFILIIISDNSEEEYKYYDIQKMEIDEND